MGVGCRSENGNQPTPQLALRCRVPIGRERASSRSPSIHCYVSKRIGQSDDFMRRLWVLLLLSAWAREVWTFLREDATRQPTVIVADLHLKYRERVVNLVAERLVEGRIGEADGQW